MTELVGTILQNRYRIVKVLAQGGQSETFVAEDTHLPGHPECVVKRLKTANKDPERLANAKRLFEREAEVLQTQLCPRFDQIPNLLAYFELDCEFYLVQELIRGHPLSDEMPTGSRWAETRVLELLRDILWVLNCIHTQGVIHRDLKPDNLIRRARDQKLVLIDFGAVKTCVWEEERASTIAIGTLGYMPFEQAMGEPVPASDLYALGMIAIQALTGVPPRQLPKVDAGEVCWQDLAPQVSEGLAEILSRMVRYRPSQRYRTAMEILDALQILDPQPGQASLLPTPSQTETQVQLSTAQPPTDPVAPSSLGPSETVTRVGAAARAPVPAVAIQSPTPQSSPSPATPISIPGRGWRGKVASVLSVALLGGLASLGYGAWSQREAEFTARLALERMNTAIAAGDFDQCSVHMAGIPADMPMFSQILERLGECQLEQARWLADQENWDQAITLVQSISSQLEIYPQAMQLYDQWSDQLRRQDLQQRLAEQGLASEAGIDYSYLGELMAAGQWQEADQETDRILLRVTGQQQAEFLDLEALETVPCTDLKTLDQLWHRLSDGQFGFTVQMMIWARSGDTFPQFADRVGWREDNLYRNYSDLEFNPQRATAGSLPFAAVLRGEQVSLYRESEWWLYRDRDHFEALFERLMTCEMI